MGTRNLTVIIKDGQIRLSQYCQWDGYFTSAGVEFLQFVKDNLQDKSKRKMKYRIEKFAEKVENSRFLTKKTIFPGACLDKRRALF